MLAEKLEHEQMRQELVVILEMAKLLEKPLDAKRSVQGILRLLSQLLGLNCGRVVVPGEDKRILEVLYSYGLSIRSLRSGRFSVGVNEGVTGHVMRTGVVGVVPDINKEPLYLRRVTEWGEAGGRSRGSIGFIAVPILESGVPIGVLSAQRATEGERGFDHDIAVLRVAASLIGQVMRIQQFVDQRTQELVEENLNLKNSIAADRMLKIGMAHGIIGSSPALLEAVRQANQVASTDAPVMLLGESGTGKEKFARMIHLQSERGEGPFICINCAAIPPDLLEAELFGFKRGSFTGARESKPGKLMLADGGTLFLDEIGDMPLALQSKLLRVLQEKQVDPIGGLEPQNVNFRVITATHVNLQEYIATGRFRLDLFYRLNVVPIALPPLRARNGDVRRLALHYLNDVNHQYGKNSVFDNETLDLLEHYAWPGNIRQLMNVVERAVLMSESSRLSPAQMRAILDEERSVGGNQPGAVPVPPPGGSAPPEAGSVIADRGMPAIGEGVRPYRRVDRAEVEDIQRALKLSGGNKTQAARILKMTARQLRYRVDKLGLDGCEHDRRSSAVP